MDNWIEVIGIVALLLVLVGVSLCSMKVPEPVQNVTSAVASDGHHVYSVNISDSVTYKER